jgi:thiamine biosynthesis protein ThiC
VESQISPFQNSSDWREDYRWNERFQLALDMPDGSREQQTAKHEHIAQLTAEYVTLAFVQVN